MDTNTAILNLMKKSPTVVEGPMGLAMPEKLARLIEQSSRGLPKDFTYRRRAYSAKQEDVDGGGRTEVSVITTDAIDRDGECVLTSGGDWKQYNRVVPFCHDYKQLPAGFNQWITAKGNSTKAKTQYPTAPPDWNGPWLPSAIWHFLQQPIPTLGDKSIGFLPMNVRGATQEEKRLRPDMDRVPIIDKWLGLEYSCVLIPCNQEAQLETVIGKGLEAHTITKEFADTLRRMVLEPSTTKTVIAMTTPIQVKAGAEADNSAGGAVVGDVVDKPKTSTVKMMMPPHVKAAMKGMTDMIKPEHLAKAEEDPSMTIHSDMATQDPEAVKAILADTPPMNCRLGKTKCMKGMDDQPDNIGIEASGKDIHDLRKKLLALPHSSEMKDFKPHVKIATVHKDMGGDYDGMDGMQGLSMSCKSVKFVDGAGNGTDIPLMGKPSTKTLWPDGPNDPIVICPTCQGKAKQVAGVNVEGIGPCDKFVCEKCDTSFLIPEQSNRIPDTVSSDGTNQSNANSPLPGWQQDTTTTKPKEVKPPVVEQKPVEIKVVPFIRPEVLERAKQKRLAEQRALLTAQLVPVAAEVLDRRMGRV